MKAEGATLESKPLIPGPLPLFTISIRRSARTAIVTVNRSFILSLGFAVWLDSFTNHTASVVLCAVLAAKNLNFQVEKQLLAMDRHMQNCHNGEIF